MHGPINIIKQVTSVGLSLFNYQDDARSNKHNKASDIKLVYLYSTTKMMHGPINIILPIHVYKHLKILLDINFF